jgi:hypothetical protein
MVQGSVASLTIVRYPPPQGDHADRQLRSASNEVVTAALLVIGGKILSGRTKGQNVGYIAEYLTAFGIDLKEVRVVGEHQDRKIVVVKDDANRPKLPGMDRSTRCHGPRPL